MNKMMRSLYSGVSGLKTFQTKMDVIGNNIANVNTPGFKKSRVIFKDKLYQSMRGASAPTGERGGTNPMSIGLGMSLGSVDQIHSQAPAAATNRSTDMAIDGNGYFILKNHAGIPVYSRMGAFDFDEQGNLNADGLIVQGWIADAEKNYSIDPSPSTIRNINIADYKMTPARSTENVSLAGNLDSSFTPIWGSEGSDGFEDENADLSKAVIAQEDVYDSLGNKQTIYFRLFKAGEVPDGVLENDETGSNWYCDISLDPEFSKTPVVYSTGKDPTGEVIRINNLVFDEKGQLKDDPAINLIINRSTVGAEDIKFDVDFSKMTQYNADSTAWVNFQDGVGPGTLSSYDVGSDGVISGVYSNGELRTLARVAVANFQNPAGLAQEGGTLFQVSNNSGEAQIGAPGDKGMGVILPSSLEMSNVDISEEFTDMIITQRGFQANSRIITSSDEMLQELVNLKR
jgi:flagellar hook protein FlgE